MRKHFLLLRKQIGEERRGQAAAAILETVLSRSDRTILSYWPIGSELDTKPLNRILAKEGRLYLPLIKENRIVSCQVSNPDTQLKLSHMRIWEPSSEFCKEAETEAIDLILVPGLAFDKQNNRLGYGEGWYDRFLSRAQRPYTIGVGFIEQMSPDPLPRDVWDIPVQALRLV